MFRASEALTACFQLMEVNSKNVALVEGVVCQIIEPDMQQTSSYLTRVVEKDAKKAQASLQRHDVRFSRQTALIQSIGSGIGSSYGCRVSTQLYVGSSLALFQCHDHKQGL
jgi:hypothetical protein